MSVSIETPQVLLVQSLQERWGSVKDKPELTLEELEKTLSQLTDEATEWQDIIDNIKSNNGIITEKDLKDFRDVAVDLSFFIMQSVVRAGLTEKYQKDFYDIFLNNSEKVCKTLIEANETQQHYIEQGVSCYVEYVEAWDHYVIKDVKEGKIRKPLGFKSVELSD